jgi:hypothetical protein
MKMVGTSTHIGRQKGGGYKMQCTEIQHVVRANRGISHHSFAVVRSTDTDYISLPKVVRSTCTNHIGLLQAEPSTYTNHIGLLQVERSTCTNHISLPQVERSTYTNHIGLLQVERTTDTKLIFSFKNQVNALATLM